MNTETLLITGASSDIGVDLIGRMLQHPHCKEIIAHYHTGESRIEKLCAAAGGRLRRIRADLSSREGVDQFNASLRAWNIVPTQYVHLPALKLKYERFSRFDWNRFQSDLQVQLGSLVEILRAGLPQRGVTLSDECPQVTKVVVVNSSVTIGVPPKYLSMYTVIKYAQLGLVRALASEYGDARLRINSISPSMIETQFLADIPGIVSEQSAKQNPMGRNARASDVTAAIEFLLSDQSDFMNGANIPLTGGSAY